MATLANRTPADLADEAGLCVHEAGHALMGTLLGGRLRLALVASGAVTGRRGLTSFSDLDPAFHAAVAYAGPWAQARFLAGCRPTQHQVYAQVNNSGRCDCAMIEACGGLNSVGPETSYHLERRFPAVTALAARILRQGEIHHSDVLEVLGLTEETAANGGLSTLRGGVWA